MQTNENTCLEVHGDEADPVHEVVEPEDDSGEEEDEAGEEEEDVDHAEPLLVLAGPLSVHAQGRLGGLGPLERRHLEVASDPGCPTRLLLLLGVVDSFLGLCLSLPNGVSRLGVAIGLRFVSRRDAIFNARSGTNRIFFSQPTTWFLIKKFQENSRLGISCSRCREIRNLCRFAVCRKSKHRNI